MMSYTHYPNPHKERKKLIFFAIVSGFLKDEERGQWWKKGLARKLPTLWRKHHIIYSSCSPSRAKFTFPQLHHS